MARPTSSSTWHSRALAVAPNMPSRSRWRILARTLMRTLRVNRRFTTPRASARTSRKPSTLSPTSSRTPSSRAAPLNANAMSSYVSSRRSTSSTRRLCLTISMPSLTKVCPHPSVAPQKFRLRPPSYRSTTRSHNPRPEEEHPFHQAR